MTRLLYALPVLAFLVLVAFLALSLMKPETTVLPSALIDKPAPALTLPALDKDTRGFGPSDLRSGHVTIINVFASWCQPCRLEGSQLASLAKVPGVAVYGLAYKDTPKNVRTFLAAYGDPYARIALDQSGQAGIEWGVYGVPETFIVDPEGVIRERIVGQLTDDALASEVLPAIERAKS